VRLYKNEITRYIKLGLILQNKIKRRDILKKRVGRRRLTMYNDAEAPGRQQELAPTKNIEIPEH